MKIFYPDIKEQNEFKKYGEQFRKIFADDEKHIYVFSRNNTDYEVIQGVKKKNPDGNIVYAYPSSEQFGSYGYYITGRNKDYAYDRICYRLEGFDEDVCKEFKNTVKTLS